ncbi:unnamed protein product, partial [Rotaria magnacalcarata]
MTLLIGNISILHLTFEEKKELISFSGQTCFRDREIHNKLEKHR